MFTRKYTIWRKEDYISLDKISDKRHRLIQKRERHHALNSLYLALVYVIALNVSKRNGTIFEGNIFLLHSISLACIMLHEIKHELCLRFLSSLCLQQTIKRKVCGWIIYTNNDSSICQWNAVFQFNIKLQNV